jgi:hypothetical protein
MPPPEMDHHDATEMHVHIVPPWLLLVVFAA